MQLNIPESLVLLSLKNDSGAKQGQFVEFALAGGAIAELLFSGHLKQDEDKPKRFNIGYTQTTRDPFLDYCFDVINKTGGGKSISTYVNKLAGKSKLFREQAQSLVQKGILVEDPQSFLVFNWSRYPEADPRAEAELIEHLSAVLFDDKDPKERDCVTIVLADKTGLLAKNFDKTMLKTHKARIKHLSEGGFAPTKAAIDAINAVQAALIAAAATAAVAASG